MISDAKRFFNIDYIDELLNINGSLYNWQAIWNIYIFLIWYGEFFSKNGAEPALTKTDDLNRISKV